MDPTPPLSLQGIPSGFEGGWLVFRSTKGFEFRAVGFNPRAARYPGTSITWSTVLSMVIAGGLAGLAGAAVLLGGSRTLAAGFSPGYGFDGIVLGLVGYTFRRAIPPRPATPPSTAPAVLPP